MTPLKIHADIYTPRWGHDDRYNFTFGKNSLTIDLDKKITKATWTDTTARPDWTGEDLFKTMRNDAIYPPHNLLKLLEHLWREWRHVKISHEQVQDELNALVEWINTSTRNKPTTEFWNAYF